ncbi:MFS transporter [Streptomyces sp. NPDC017940]|uniref:MFS transporter n=1 Tax=Streptomyces sp. NPDC017940 TaxID=3365017 RepID=UPI00378C5E31
MGGVRARVRAFEPAVQLLFVNQFSINLGFYMLMPYLAAHLSGDLGLAAWAVGLVLGVRNLSQQGMFLVGGALADRLGYKPMIVAGCALRTAGFAALAFAQTLPVLIAASAATGLAGALFNPAVRAYVAAEAGTAERRVEAFALFNVFYQTGILLGPLVGLALTGVDFKLTCAVAAVLFAVLSVVQVLRLPVRRGEAGSSGDGDGDGVGAGAGAGGGQWRAVFGNRPFWLFSLAMTGSYVLSFQVYLALPLEVERLLGGGTSTTVATSALFVVSGLVALVGQLRITDWCKRTWTREQCLVAGLGLMGTAFLPPALGGPGYAGVTVLLLCAAALAAANAVLYPFEMDTVVSLARERWVATHYGLYNTVCGVGITAGNLAMGALLDLGESRGLPAVPWLVLAALGAGCALALRALGRSGRLTAPVPALGGDTT